MTILITGATGRMGSTVIEALTERDAPVRALVRRPEAAAELPAGVEVAVGDLTEPASLDGALRGVESVFLVWTAPPDTAGAVVDRVAAQARRVVYLSAPHRTPHPFFQQPNPMAALHARVEELLAAAGIGATMIRPGMFASNALHWWGADIRAGRAVRWPYGAVETAPVDDRDVAEVVARALCEDGHAGGDYVLTGPESLGQAEQVRVIGQVLGRAVAFEELAPAEFRLGPATAMLLAAWEASAGRRAYVTSTIAGVLGRPPRTFRQWVTDHAGEFSSRRAA